MYTIALNYNHALIPAQPKKAQPYLELKFGEKNSSRISKLQI